MRTIVFILFVVSFSGCVRTEFSPWIDEVQPVVFSIISPGNQIQVYLGRSGEIESNYLQISYPEANVYITNSFGSKVKLLRFDDNSSIFVDKFNEMNVCYGCTYYLNVELSGLEIKAETTIPEKKGKILSASCVIPVVTDAEIDSLYVGYATLKVNMKLIDPDYFGYYLSAFKRPLNRAILYSSHYFDQYFYLPQETQSFKLNLITTDPVYRRFLVSNQTDSRMVTADIVSIINAFGGVQPAFTNIINGVGMFGSFVTDSIMVDVVQH